MAAPEVYSLADVPVSAYSFSADKQSLAVSLNSNVAQILTRSGNDWKVTESLSEHDKLITSIDWAPKSNRIVTASQDRNAYVWQQLPDPETGKHMWKPTLVAVRINRGATAVRWSPKEDKFAVASGARTVAICNFDEENNWWVSKHIKKPIRSTVLAIDWHPNNVLLAAGSADMKARVFSAFIKDVDKRPAATVWGERLPFNTLCGEYGSPSGGWVHSVAFSPSGDVLAFTSHDSTISIVYPQGPVVVTIRSSSLPYVTLTWTAEDALIAAGHDCQPVLFQGNQNGWKTVGSLDDPSVNKSTASTPSRVGTGRLNSAAFNTFRDADTRGTRNVPSGSSPGGSGGTELTTIHLNTITNIRPYEYGNDGTVTKVSTGGVDGKLVIWDTSNVGALGSRLGGMRLR